MRSAGERTDVSAFRDNILEIGASSGVIAAVAGWLFGHRQMDADVTAKSVAAASQVVSLVSEHLREAVDRIEAQDTLIKEMRAEMGVLWIDRRSDRLALEQLRQTLPELVICARRNHAEVIRLGGVAAPLPPLDHLNIKE
jgi:hypothetical protein